MERLFSRKTAEKVLDEVIQRINEANENEEFIYIVSKAVLFGSFINSSKEKIGDLDIAIYLELKDISIPELEQNELRYCKSGKLLPDINRLFYGKEEVCKFIKNRKNILELHDGNQIEALVKRTNLENYVYSDNYEIIYEYSK